MVDVLVSLESADAANLSFPYPVMTCGDIMASKDMHVLISAPIDITLTAFDTSLILVIAHFPTFSIT